MVQVVLATHNEGKVREIQSLLQGLPVVVLSAGAVGLCEVEETGATYEANALLKARAAALQCGLLAMADDSGLEVDALGGEPGVRSARYAGPDSSDEERYLKVLSAMTDVPPEQRTARFRCVIALADPRGQTRVVEGCCEGRITSEPRGAEGFGYDPIFEVPELGRTMAELTRPEKALVSHRGKALLLARDALASMLRP
ncbi:MAG TPA: XTP/dITP diphosphatase [Armatimonadota bacterium]